MNKLLLLVNKMCLENILENNNSLCVSLSFSGSKLQVVLRLKYSVCRTLILLWIISLWKLRREEVLHTHTCTRARVCVWSKNDTNSYVLKRLKILQKIMWPTCNNEQSSCFKTRNKRARTWLWDFISPNTANSLRCLSTNRLSKHCKHNLTRLSMTSSCQDTANSLTCLGVTSSVKTLHARVCVRSATEEKVGLLLTIIHIQYFCVRQTRVQ